VGALLHAAIPSAESALAHPVIGMPAALSASQTCTSTPSAVFVSASSSSLAPGCVAMNFFRIFGQRLQRRRLAVQEDLLILGQGQGHARLGGSRGRTDGLALRQRDLHPRLVFAEGGGGDEEDQQDHHDVDQRHDGDHRHAADGASGAG